LKIDAPLPAAEVRKPDRSEWPEKVLASKPARAAYALTVFATDRQVSLEPRTAPALSIGRKIGRAWPEVDKGTGHLGIPKRHTPPTNGS